MPLKTSVSFLLCALVTVLSLSALAQGKNGPARPNWDGLLPVPGDLFEKVPATQLAVEREEFSNAPLRAGNRPKKEMAVAVTLLPALEKTLERRLKAEQAGEVRFDERRVGLARDRPGQLPRNR